MTVTFKISKDLTIKKAKGEGKGTIIATHQGEQFLLGPLVMSDNWGIRFAPVGGDLDSIAEEVVVVEGFDSSSQAWANAAEHFAALAKVCAQQATLAPLKTSSVSPSCDDDEYFGG